MTERLVDPLRLGRPLELERRERDRREPQPEGTPGRKRRASSVTLLLAMLVAALVVVPGALADDDGDDNGGGPAQTPSQLTCAAANAAGNLVQNGDFEIPAVVGFFITYPGPTGPPGWLETKGSVDQVHASFWTAACGNQSMDMTGTPGQGELSQLVPNVAGQQYTLRFAYAANPDPACTTIGEPATVTLEARWGAFSQTFNITRTPDSPPPPFSPEWQFFSATVTGPGPAPLEFESLSGNFCGPTLDAVSITLLDDDDDDDDGDDDDDDDNGDDDGGDDDDGDDDDD